MLSRTPYLPWIRLTMTSTQSISNNTITTLSFDTVSGTYNWAAPGTPVTALTIPISGIYQYYLHDLDWGDSGVAISTGIRRFGRVLSGGVTTRRMCQTMVGAGGTANNQSVQSGGEFIYLPKDETLAMICLQTSGGSLNAAANDLFVRLIQPGTFSLA